MSQRSNSCEGSQSDASGMPEQLTPRSKIRRMLNAFDDEDSDKENAARPASDAAKQAYGLERLEQPFKSRKVANLRPFDDSESDEVHDAETTAFKPSKAAAKGQNNMTASHYPADGSSDSDTADETGATAYARIKQQLKGTQHDTRTREHKRASVTSIGSNVPRSLSQSPIRQTQRSQASSTSPSQTRQSSPGLFVSPSRTQGGADSDSDVRVDEPSETRSRLQELIARKRHERDEKEKAAKRCGINESDVDEASAERPEFPKKKLSDHRVSVDEGSMSLEKASKARPTRNASKKATEEMSRETQRISRNMQLAHQAKTRTKFTTTDLFKKFNFRQPKSAQPPSPTIQTQRGSSSPTRANSDDDTMRPTDTPPSSPPSLGGSEKVAGHQQADNHLLSKAVPNNHLRSLDPLIRQSSQHKYKNLKSHGNGSHSLATAHAVQKPSLKSFMKSAKRKPMPVIDSDDLEIVDQSKPSRIAILDNLPSKTGTERQSMHILRALAHLNDKNHERILKGSMTPHELKAALTRRAREQAKMAELEKIQEAKDKGKYVESAEERERNLMQIESMIEKAQRENAELAKREKEAAKREGKDTLEHLPDSDDDEEFEPSDDEDIQFSGSDNEEGAEDVDGSEEDEEDLEAEADDEGEDEEASDVNEAEDRRHSNPFIEGNADEDNEGAESTGSLINEDEDEDMRASSLQTPKPKSSRKKRIVIEDDSDDEQPPPVTPAAVVAKTPGSKASIAQAFGFAHDRSPAVGLSQLWGGTMAETQTQEEYGVDASDSQQDSLAFLRGLPQVEPFPSRDGFQDPTQEECIQDSQSAPPFQTPARDTQAIRLSSDGRSPRTQSQASPLFNATQDVGFDKTLSPALAIDRRGADGEHSTIDTVMLPSEESPVARRKNRSHPDCVSSDVQIQSSDQENGGEVSDRDAASIVNTSNAFTALKKGARRADKQAAFDKRKSEARELFEEQAEESEDEYAGLGGVSDDESGSEIDEEMQKLIDDDNSLKLNRRKAAEFHAEWERDRDTKNTTKLYRDITTGALRRQQDHGADLFDWDDEDEREARRRAIRLRKEARQRKALIDSGKLDGVVDNPKRQAFMSAVEDFADDDEIMFLDDEDEGHQSQTARATTDSHKRKRNDEEECNDVEQVQDNRAAMPPPKSRRRAEDSHPQSNLAIKRTLSSLIDDPNDGDADVVADSQEVVGAYSAPPKNDSNIATSVGSDKENGSDLEINDPPSRETSPDASLTQRAASPPRHTRRKASPARAAVIDRMALKRQSSSAQGNNGSHGSRLAFQAPSTTSFKVPSLLRRATTNASLGSEGSLAEKSAAAGITGQAKEGVRMGGSKKSSINWHIREAERMEKIERGERERKQDREKWRGAMKRHSGLGSFGGGGFE